MSLRSCFFPAPHGVDTQDQPRAPASKLDAKEVAAGAACPLAISKLRSEQAAAGWTPHVTPKNTSDTDVSDAEPLRYTLAPRDDYDARTGQFVNTDDLPIPAHETKDTTVVAH